MPSVDLFAEDQAHELFVVGLATRIFSEADINASIGVRSAVGGHGKAVSELQIYQRAVQSGAAGLSRPDLLVVLIDANCKGATAARSAIQRVVSRDVAGEILIACPDPHIERWFFADPEAF